MINGVGMMWGDKSSKETMQEFALRGVEYFTKKYGYPPTMLEYRIEDGKIDIPNVECMGVTSNAQRGHILFYPAEDRTKLNK